MSGWVHDLGGVGIDDQAPIAYEVTVIGWRHGPELLTPTEAAQLARVERDRVHAAARSGVLAATKVGRCWLIERDSLHAWAEARACRAAARRRMPAAPLLEAIAARGGRTACGVRAGSADERALDRAARAGYVTEQMADRLAASLLGRTTWEVWG